MSAIEGISIPVLRRYLHLRRDVGQKAKHASDITYLLSLLHHCDSDTIDVDPQVLASFADQINADVCSILEQLDEFIYIVDAENALNQ